MTPRDISTGALYRRPNSRDHNRARYLAATQGGEVDDHLHDIEADKAHGVFDDTELTAAWFRQVATYDYTSPAGKLLYQVLRYEHPEVPGCKQFRERRWGKTGWLADAGLLKVPYRWPELIVRPNETVFFAEGEKDGDRLAALGLLATTLAGQHWSPEAAKAFRGRDVVILPDNDRPGRKHASEAVQRLQGLAACVRVVELPGLGMSEDVSDWLDAGHVLDDLRALVKSARPVGIRANVAGWIDPATVPLRTWLYKPPYISQFVSLMLSTGGVGKSSLGIAEALAMVSGKALLGVQPQRRLRVWYWNGEDPLDELRRRFAAAQKHYELTPEDIGDRLFIDSGRTMPIVIAQEISRGAVQVDEQTVAELVASIASNKIDVMIVDPFVTCHRVPENDNGAIERVAKSWSHIAEVTNCAVMLVHHSRKPNGNALEVDDGRGASALLAAVRSARVLNTMKSNEAALAEIPESQRRFYFRADIGKANLAPPPEDASWFKIHSLDLGNAFPFGDEVGVVTAWRYPKTEAIAPTRAETEAAQDAIRAGEGWRRDQRSAKWVGIPIAQALGRDLTEARTRKAVAKLVKDWLAAGWLRSVTRRDKGRHAREFIEVGSAPVRN